MVRRSGTGPRQYNARRQNERFAGKYVLTHCCRSIKEILPDLIEIGLDAYQSVQPEAANSTPYDLKLK